MIGQAICTFAYLVQGYEVMCGHVHVSCTGYAQEPLLFATTINHEVCCSMFPIVCGYVYSCMSHVHADLSP